MAISLSIFGRPLHLKEFKAWYEGEPEDDYETATDLSAMRTALNTAQVETTDAFKNDNDALINALDTDMQNYVDANKTGDTITVGAAALKTYISDLIQAVTFNYTGFKSNLAADVSTHITGDTATVSIAAVLEKVHTDYIAALTTEGRTVKHGRCQGLGHYLKSQDTGVAEDATKKKLCPGCQAFGKLLTSTTDTPIQTFPVVDEYPEEIEIPE